MHSYKLSLKGELRAIRERVESDELHPALGGEVEVADRRGDEPASAGGAGTGYGGIDPDNKAARDNSLFEYCVAVLKGEFSLLSKDVVWEGI